MPLRRKRYVKPGFSQKASEDGGREGQTEDQKQKNEERKTGNANRNQEVEKSRSGVLWPPTGAGPA